MTILIPNTIAEARESLGGIGRLLTAKQWERAAIVYAFTKEVGRGGNHGNDGNPALTIAEFAGHKIVGLSTREQVTAYRAAWQAAIDAGKAEPVQPGDVIEPPAMDWKESFGSPSDQTPAVQERVTRQVLRDRPEAVADAIPAAVAKVIETVPEAGGRIADVVAESRIGEAVHGRMVDKHDEERERREKRESYERPAARAVESVITAIERFYDTTITVQGQPRTYREIIEFTLDNPDLLMQHWTVPSASVRTSLLRALESMRIESAQFLDRLALVAGEAQE